MPAYTASAIGPLYAPAVARVVSLSIRASLLACARSISASTSVELTVESSSYNWFNKLPVSPVLAGPAPRYRLRKVINLSAFSGV